MNKKIKLALLTGFIITATGCANTSQLEEDISSLQSQVSTLSAKVDEANERSKSAEASAQNAEQTAADTNSKLDRVFKKSMMK